MTGTYFTHRCVDARFVRERLFPGKFGARNMQNRLSFEYPARISYGEGSSSTRPVQEYRKFTAAFPRWRSVSRKKGLPSTGRVLTTLAGNLTLKPNCNFSRATESKPKRKFTFILDDRRAFHRGGLASKASICSFLPPKCRIFDAQMYSRRSMHLHPYTFLQYSCGCVGIFARICAPVPTHLHIYSCRCAGLTLILNMMILWRC